MGSAIERLSRSGGRGAPAICSVRSAQRAKSSLSALPARRAFWLFLLLLPALAGAEVRRAGAAGGEVRLLVIDGVINSLTARYLKRELRRAAEEGIEATVLRLNTPGGLESATRAMAETMLNARVPVVVYVAPAGARAASAGMFITLAAHVAAMAPATNIGAAHPVGLGGGQANAALEAKLVNDAAALARAIAVARGRNAAWAERAVRESVSITAAEALKLDVINLVAADLAELLRRIDGREVKTAAGVVTLETAAARIVERQMSLPERILQTIADPNIAYILFTIGVIGLIAELYNPGMLFPGIAGAIALLLALAAFGSLPISWAAVLLLLLAIALFVAELFTEGLGILGVGGIVAFVLGSLMLYTPLTPKSPAMPDVQVSPWVIAAMTAVFAGFFFLVLRALFRARHAPLAAGIEALVGRIGVAVSDLTPAGTVQLDSEKWSAVAEDAIIRAGEKVTVVGVEGVTLRVVRR